MRTSFVCCDLLVLVILTSFSFVPNEAAGPSPSHEDEWCYWEDPACNPNTWPGICATGKRQSPIDLNIYSVSSTIQRIFIQPTEPRLGFMYSEQDLIFESFGIQNTGHSVQITFPATVPPIAFDPFYPNYEKSYIFAQAHFHWGTGNGFNGSEHAINGRMYDGELHLVHYASQYNSITSALNAKNDPQAVMVIAILLKGSQRRNPYLQPIIKAIPSIIKYDKDQSLAVHPVYESLNLEALFPNKLNFFRYFGSLTSPGCDEHVLWIVYQNPISISYNQLTAFRQVEDVRGLKLVENFRHLQDRNFRKIGYHVVEGNPSDFLLY